MGNQQQLPPGQSIRGPIHAVPCPHCGKPNDLRGMQEQQLLDTHSRFVCDYCNNHMMVTAVQPVTFVSVRKAAPGSINRGADAHPAQPARTVGQGVLKRLLGLGPGPRKG